MSWKLYIRHLLMVAIYWVIDRFTGSRNVIYKGQRLGRNCVVQNLTIDNLKLEDLDLSGSVLRNVYFLECQLNRVDLRYATCSGITIKDSILVHCYLLNSNWHNVSLTSSTLNNCAMAGISWVRGYIGDSTVIACDLFTANLVRSNFNRVTFRETSLEYARTFDSVFIDVAGLVKPPIGVDIIPEGDLIVYKKLKGGVAKLLVPKEAKRSNAGGRKCRAEYAIVLECPEDARSTFDQNFIYKVGETVRPKRPWEENRWKECAPGIHFFLTRREAEDYAV